MRLVRVVALVIGLQLGAVGTYAQDVPSTSIGPGQAYVTDDPVNPDRLGLATQSGRYMIGLLLDSSVNPTCGLVHTGIDVNVAGPLNSEGSIYSLAPSDQDAGQHGCPVRVFAQMDRTPCEQIDGVCTVAADVDDATN